METFEDKQKKQHIIAAVGDVHGNMGIMVRGLEGRKADIIFAVGDFEAHRDEADLATMAAPSKYKTVGDFPEFYSGKQKFRLPVYFIGGNHEPYGFLDTLDTSNGPVEIIENCYYLGRSGLAEISGLKIAWVSGIYSQEHYNSPRPQHEIGISNKEFIYFTKEDVVAAISDEPVDLMIVHEWPAGILPEDSEKLEELRSISKRIAKGETGSEELRVLVEINRPKLLICGHMHVPYETQIVHSDGFITRVCALGKVGETGDIRFFRSEGTEINLIEP